MPFDIRNSMSLLLFKNKLYQHLWNIALTDIEQSEDEWSFQSSDDDGYAKTRKDIFCDNLGLGLGYMGLFFVFSSYTNTNFDIIINIISI